MRKFTAVFIAAFILLSAQLVPAYAQDQVSVIINGRAIQFDVAPVISRDKVLVPMRTIFEALGASVVWDAGSRTVTCDKGSLEVVLRIDSADAWVNGKLVTLDVAATIVNDKTFVPARFISESLGANVNWNSRTRTVTINDNDIYSAIKDGIEKLQDNIDISPYVGGAGASDKAFAALNKVLADNPDIFYVENQKTLYWSNGVLEVAYQYPKDKIQQLKDDFAARQDFIINSLIKPGMSDYDKELAVHDYIVKNTKYDEVNYEKGTVPLDSYSAYGVLMKKVAVCEGYAKAMQLLLNKSGVECRLVVGEATSNDSGVKSTVGHAWNIVKVGGEYYQVDATWDDPVPDGGSNVSYNYFNVTDRQMAVNHAWDSGSYPECAGIKYNYFYKNGLVADSYQKFYAMIKNAIADKSGAVLIKVSNYDENVYNVADAVKKAEDQLPDLGYYITEWSGDVDCDTGVINIRNIKYADKQP